MLSIILFSITILFFILIVIKKKIDSEYFCPVCGAVSLTWITLFILYYLGYFEDKTILALLMGQSVVGIYYLWEKMASEEVKVYRLPFLLTMTLITALLLNLLDGWKDILFSIGIIGITTGFLYISNRS